MKTLKRWVSVLFTGLLCGCLQVEDELTVQPDGSGTVRITVQANVPEEATAMFGSGFGRGGSAMYPPLSEAEARRFFPTKDFTVKIEEKGAGEGKKLLIEAGFKDINALLASPYGRAHQLALTTSPAKLKLQALSGAEGIARAANMKAEGEMADFQMPGMEDLQKKKGEMRFQFRVTLPNAINEASGAREGKSATWTVERAKCKDDEEFATKLSAVLEASCPADALKFSPVTPPRLGLLPFAQLTPGVAAVNPTKLPDTNKIASAARFVPYALHVTRSLDLSGEGSGRPSQAQLIGAVVVPDELAPQRWGQVKLLEAEDAKGKSLVPKEDPDSPGRFGRFNQFGMESESDDEETSETSHPKATGEQQHMIALSFNAPDWKVKQIGRVKGIVSLQYLGASEIVKLSNAVPANLVMDMSERSDFSRFGSDRGQIADARLTDLGLSLRLDMAMAQGGMTTLSLETSGAKTSLVDVQVFDASGRPWPTMLIQSDPSGGEEHSCQIMVAGQPKPPFSLGLLVSGVGASVDVPLLVEKVPVGDK